MIDAGGVGRADSAGAGDVVMRGNAAGVGPGALCVGGERSGGRGRRADFAEGLAADAAALAIARTMGLPLCAVNSGREVPAAEHAAEDALLAAEELGRIVQREVVDELDVEDCGP